MCGTGATPVYTSDVGYMRYAPMGAVGLGAVGMPLQTTGVVGNSCMAANNIVPDGYNTVSMKCPTKERYTYQETVPRKVYKTVPIDREIVTKQVVRQNQPYFVRTANTKYMRRKAKVPVTVYKEVDVIKPVSQSRIVQKNRVVEIEVPVKRRIRENQVQEQIVHSNITRTGFKDGFKTCTVKVPKFRAQCAGTVMVDRGLQLSAPPETQNATVPVPASVVTQDSLSLSQGLSQAQGAQGTFNDIDTNRDGVISAEEFANAGGKF